MYQVVKIKQDKWTKDKGDKDKYYFLLWVTVVIVLIFLNKQKLYLRFEHGQTLY